MSDIRIPQNPGIAGLSELTTVEKTFLQNLAALSYATGDILYYNGSTLTRLPIGSSTEVLTVTGGVPVWAAGGGGGGSQDLQDVTDIGNTIDIVDDSFAIRVRSIDGSLDKVTMGNGTAGDGFIGVFKDDGSVGISMEGDRISATTVVGNIDAGLFRIYDAPNAEYGQISHQDSEYNFTDYLGQPAIIIAGSGLFTDLTVNSTLFIADSATNKVRINTSVSVGSLNVAPLSSSGIGMVVSGVASQTGSIQEWRNSAGTTLSRVSANGGLGISTAIANPAGVIFAVGPNTIADSNLPVQFSSATDINYIGLNKQTSGYGGLIGYTETEFGGGLVMRNVTGKDIHFITTNTLRRMTISGTTGNVAIGDHSAGSARLDVRTVVTNNTTVTAQYLVNAGSGNNTGAALQLGFGASAGSTAGISGYYTNVGEAGMYLGFNSAGTQYMTMSPTGRLGLGTAAPSARIHAVATTEQIRLGYDASNYWNATTDSTGITTFNAVGSGASFIFSDIVTANNLAVTATSVPVNGIYLPASNTLGFAVNTTAEVQLTATAFSPATNDGNALGTSGLQWGDLFLAEGGVINWDNGDATLTQAGDVLTLTGADLKVTTPGNVSTSILTTDATQTLTNKRVQPRTASSTTASTLTPDLSSANIYYRTTQTATLTINAPTGTPVIGETIVIYVDSASAQTLTMNATYIPFGAAFPATTTAGKTLMITAQYNGTDWKTLTATAV